jgi:hypothetical protein
MNWDEIHKIWVPHPRPTKRIFVARKKQSVAPASRSAVAWASRPALGDTTWTHTFHAPTARNAGGGLGWDTSALNRPVHTEGKAKL